ncbi:MAG: hypothetical protein L6265_00785, partial [Thermoplasmatales archaeon]|nr:hypothetical protein [Thermoplasmatales archaeon]
YYLTKEFFNKKAGVIAAFLIAIMPNHIQGTGLGLSDHDPMCLFFIVLAFFFLVKALKTLNQKKWVAEWRKGQDIKKGFGVLFRENKASLGYAVMAGFSILTVALIWEGFIYILAILLIYYILQLVINHMRHEDSLGFCIITLIVIGVPMLSMLSAPYFSAVPGILQGSLPSTWYIFVAILVVSILFVPTRDVPWVIVIPSVAVIGGASYAGLWHFSPALATSLLGGAGYFIKTKVYGTIGEAQATDVNRFAFAYGQITFYLAMIALFLLIVEYMRFWKKDRLLMVVWTVTAIYMTMGAIRFMFNATPVFAILSGWIIWEIIGKVDFRTMIKNVHGMRGNKFYAMKK